MLRHRLAYLKYWYCFLISSGVSIITYAQNLLPNPGFEDYLDCPSEDHGLYLASQWYTNISDNRSGNGTWNPRNYIHACDPEVEPWWPSELGDGVISYLYRWDRAERLSLTQLVWTELLAPLEKDSLYYVEFTTAPTQIYYIPDATYIMPWCVPQSVGVKLAEADFDGRVSPLDPITPDMTAESAGVVQKIKGTSQFGNCFTATGLERYFLYGFFLDDTPLADYQCIGGRAHTELGWSWFTADNFILEKMKLDIFSDTIVCEKREIDFSKFVDYYALRKKKIVWNDGVEGAKRSFTQSGQYQFTMISDCGSIASSWVNITTKRCQLRVFVPDAFSPNGDAVNALFIPYFSDDFEVTGLQFSVFNRWGELVFRTNDVDTPGWDGTIRGEVASQGTYLWQLVYEFREGTETVTELEAGEVTLVR